MNKFELFCLIFFALDAQWDNAQNEALGNYLSDAKPFLWADIASADPECYDTFCKIVKDNNIALKDSYNVAKNYIEKLAKSAVTEAFLKTDETQWLAAAKEYLSSPHKGEDLDD